MSAYVPCGMCRGAGEVRCAGSDYGFCDQLGTHAVHAIECPDCQGLGDLPRCPCCGDGITGCVWNGRCLDCHELSFLPETAEDRWDAAYAD